MHAAFAYLDFPFNIGNVKSNFHMFNMLQQLRKMLETAGEETFLELAVAVSNLLDLRAVFLQCIRPCSVWKRKKRIFTTHIFTAFK